MIVHTNKIVSKVFGEVLGGLGLERLQPLLLYGPTGVGKIYYLRTLIRAISCKTYTPFKVQNSFYKEECVCGICNKIKTNNSPDVLILNGSEGVGEFKSNLVNFVNRSPVELNYRFILAEGIHKYSGATANTFLKIVEEHPPWVKILTTTNRLDLVIPTLKSRCHCFKLSYLNKSELEQILLIDPITEKLVQILNQFEFDSIDQVIIYQKHLFKEHYEQFFTNLNNSVQLEHNLNIFLGRISDDVIYKREFVIQSFLKYYGDQALMECTNKESKSYQILYKYLQEILRRFMTTIIFNLDRPNYQYYINLEHQLYWFFNSVLCARKELGL